MGLFAVYRACAVSAAVARSHQIENKPQFLPGAMIALGNTGVTKTGVVGVAACGEMRHSKIKNIVWLDREFVPTSVGSRK